MIIYEINAERMRDMNTPNKLIAELDKVRKDKWIKLVEQKILLTLVGKLGSYLANSGEDRESK